MRRAVLLTLLGAALTSLAPAGARAQLGAFGQNKIQYRDFDWHVLQGEHVDVYFYPEEEAIARMALSYAEESYDVLERRLNHRVSTRIPLIVYASHTDFEQTNVLPFVPPEGVLGVTDYLKRRVTMPFRGSYAEFRHTLRHELVHVFQLSMFTQQFTLYPRGKRPSLPLWWSEGLAEYLSSAQESRDEMVLRDLALHGRLPTIAQLNATYSPIVYPVGGDLHHFLAERYGEWRIPLLYSTLSQYLDFDDALRKVYGRSTEELTAEWHYELRRRYFPGAADRRPLEVAGRALADLAVKPSVARAPTGEVEVAYLSPRSGYTNIYLAPLDSGRPRVVVAGERTPEFESFHAFTSRIDMRDGVIVFASKFHDRDALFFWHVDRRKVVGRYQFDSLTSILSPAWSPDGRRIAFNGLSNGGISDLYLLDLDTHRLTRVTEDRYEESDPAWLPGGDALVFSSDRAPGGDEGMRNLYRIGLADRRITPLTSGAWVDEAPRWDPEIGRILFASDRDGSFNIYSVDTLGSGRRETRLDGATFDPSPVPGDDRILIGGFSDLSWTVRTLLPDSAAHADTFSIAPAASVPGWTWHELQDTSAVRVAARRYRRRFALDFAVGGGAYAPGYGAQGAQFYFSDLLGDHTVAVGLAAFQTAGGLSDFLSNLNVDVFYLNQTRRLNWGAGVFRLAGTFYGRDFDEFYSEKSTGAYGVLRYPFSRFLRLEAQGRVEYSDRDDFANSLVFGPQERRGVLLSNFAGIVGDNTLWLPTGPVDGMRFNLTGGVVSDVSHGVFENWVGVADVRRYFRTTQQSALAVRAFAFGSEGVRPRAISIGGSWFLRGYPRFATDGTRAWLGNAEYRFPIANFVTLGFPAGVLRLPQIQGAVFGDLAQAWYKGEYERRVLGSAGFGVRTALGPGLVLRLDVGRRFALGDESVFRSDARPGRFTDFFFGYNF